MHMHNIPPIHMPWPTTGFAKSRKSRETTPQRQLIPETALLRLVCARQRVTRSGRTDVRPGVL